MSAYQDVRALGRRQGKETQVNENIKHLPNATKLAKLRAEDIAGGQMPSEEKKVRKALGGKSVLEEFACHHNDITCTGTLFLEVVFDAHGEEKTVKFCKRPVGAEFSKKSNGPVKVSKVLPESYASWLGIEVGWVLQSIGGEDMSQRTFQATQETLKSGLKMLPEETPQCDRNNECCATSVRS